MISKKPYECDFLNEHLGELKFSYSTIQAYRKEDIHSLSKSKKYITGVISRIVTETNNTYYEDEWIELMKTKINELGEEFILKELIIKTKNKIYNKNKKSKEILLDALKSYSYRFWETSDQKDWVDFNSMLNKKYKLEMSSRLINK